MSPETAPHDQPPLLDIEALFADPEFAAATISPDGKRIAYLAPAHGRRNVWVRELDDDHGDALLVTHDSRRGITNFLWAGDPRWLLYLQDTDGNEDWHLFRVDLEAPDEPAVDLTPLEPGSRVFGAERLHQEPGMVLVWMNQDPMSIETFRLDVASGEMTLHVSPSQPTETVLLDRQGSPAFATRIDENGDLQISAIMPGSEERRALHSVGGAEYPVGTQPQVVTADGSGLIIGLYGDSDDLQLLRIDRADGAISIVKSVPGHSVDISGGAAPGVLPPPTYHSASTGELIAARFVGDKPLIEVIDESYADVFADLAALSDGVLGTLSSDNAERYWIATYGHDREPGVTWLYDRTTGQSRQLFQAYPDLDPETLAPMTPITLPARDGLPLPSFLTLPIGVASENLPLVLMVHGGPWLNDTWGYNPVVQFLANRGYAVLQVNFRGSGGYGAKHITAAIGELAGAMHDDLIDAGDWAVAQGYADPERIGIFGGSYGGYAALVGVTVTPDYFAAAVDYVGISDLVNFLRTLPPFTRPYNVNGWYRYAGDPDDPAAVEDMRARSPITMVDRIRTPLLVAQGANDVRVVKAESDNIVTSLRDRGVPVEYLVAEDEGHGFENPENQFRLYRAIERHFAEHLGGRSGPS